MRRNVCWLAALVLAAGGWVAFARTSRPSGTTTEPTPPGPTATSAPVPTPAGRTSAPTASLNLTTPFPKWGDATTATPTRTLRWAGGPPAGAGTATDRTAPIPTANTNLTPPGGAKGPAGGLNLTAPFPKAGDAPPAGRAPQWAGAGKAAPERAAPAGAGAKVGGAAALTPGQELALLAEARLLVSQIEATGNLTFEREESVTLTLLVYEALRRQPGRVAAGNAMPAPVPATAP